MEPRYLNVDCILGSQEALGALLDALKPDVFLLWSDLSGPRQSAGFETKLQATKGPQEDIAEFLRILEALPIDLREMLARCHEKRMDIGFESGQSGDPLNVSIPGKLLHRLTSLGFELSIRIYPSTPDESTTVLGKL